MKCVEVHWGDKKDTKGHEKDARCVRKDVWGHWAHCDKVSQSFHSNEEDKFRFLKIKNLLIMTLGDL